MGEAKTATVEVSPGARVYFSLTRGAVSDASDWDLLFEGWTIRLNGGASGSGAAGAVVVDEPFDGITDASDMGTLYQADRYGGAFAAHPWYRYNITGKTPDLADVRRLPGEARVEVWSSSSRTTSRRRQVRHVTMRYERLAD